MKKVYKLFLSVLLVLTLALAFAACDRESDMKAIPSSVINIKNSAFRSCSGLMSITIPSSVTSIGEYAFQDCSGLTTVYYGGEDVSEWNAITIDSGNKPLNNVNRYYYSETQKGGNYWRYVDGVPAKWN